MQGRRAGGDERGVLRQARTRCPGRRVRRGAGGDRPGAAARRAERAHLMRLAQEANGSNVLVRPSRRPKRRAVRPSLQWTLDAITSPAIVVNNRQDLLAANLLGWQPPSSTPPPAATDQSSPPSRQAAPWPRRRPPRPAGHRHPATVEGLRRHRVQPFPGSRGAPMVLGCRRPFEHNLNSISTTVEWRLDSLCALLSAWAGPAGT